MKNFLKVLSLCLIVCFLLSSVLAGCSNSSQKEAPKIKDSSEKQPESKRTESSEKKEITLEFTYWGSPIEKQAVEGALKQFEEKNPGIKVKGMHIPADYNTKITTMVAGGEAPDVAYMEAVLGLPWAEEGKFYDLLGLMDKDPDLTPESFLDKIWYYVTPETALGPQVACESMGLFYSKTAFETADVELPPVTAEEAWTWDEFVEVAKQLTIDQNGKNALDANFDPQNIKQYGVQFDTWYGGYAPMIFSNGGDYISEDGTEFALDDPEAVEAIQKMADLINVHHVAPSPVQAKNIPAPAVALQTGKVAMTLNGQWILLDLADAGIDFGVGVLPKMKESLTMVLGGVVVVFEDTEYPDESFELWKWFYNPESVIDLHTSGLWMPAMTDWYTEQNLIDTWMTGAAHPEGYYEAFGVQTLENAHQSPYHYVRNFPQINSLVGPALDQVWLGEKTAEEAMKEIAPKVQAEIKGRYK